MALFVYGMWFVAGRGDRAIGVHERLDESINDETPDLLSRRETASR
ncbi:MAG: hypothetical protein ABW033_00975 [Acidimicrobiia bacterium]